MRGEFPALLTQTQLRELIADTLALAAQAKIKT